MTTSSGTLPTDYDDTDIYSAGSVNLINTYANTIVSGLKNFLLGSDMNLGSLYGAAGSPGTWTEIGVCNVAAGACDSWVGVVINMYSDTATNSNDPPDSWLTSEFDLLIGESGSEASKYTGIHMKTSSGLSGTSEARDITNSQVYMYFPSADEKSNGFQVQVKGKIAAFNGAGTIYCNHIFVFGI